MQTAPLKRQSAIAHLRRSSDDDRQSRFSRWAIDYPVIPILLGLIAALSAATATASLIARAGFPLPPDKARIGCIDGLRGYLALAVLGHHFIIWTQITRLGGLWANPTNLFFSQLGSAGVALFFMTTGLVFYPRILKGFGAASWPSIYIGRIFRIMPLIAASVAIISFIIAARGMASLDPRYPIYAVEWITSWSQPPLLGFPDSGRFNAYVLWSLRHEWLFYLLVLPGCAIAMDAIRGHVSSWAVPVALLVLAVLAQLLKLPGTIWPFLPLFAMGMLAYECQQVEHLAKSFRTPAIAVIAAAGLLTCMIFFATPYGFGMPLFAFFFFCVACGNDMGGILRTRGALVLGECSYGIYLLHGTILILLFEDAATLTGSLPLNILPLIMLPMAAILVTVTTAITHLTVERPAIALGRHIGRLWTRRGAGVIGPEADVAP